MSENYKGYNICVQATHTTIENGVIREGRLISGRVIHHDAPVAEDEFTGNFFEGKRIQPNQIIGAGSPMPDMVKGIELGVPAGAAPILPNADLLLQLADRCEREMPNLALRCDIAKALGWREVEHDCHIRMVDPDGKMWWAAQMPDPTANLDAALTLVPEEWTAWELRSSAKKTRFSADLSRLTECDSGEDWTYGRASTPALALCAAALRARANSPPRGLT